MGSHPKQWKSFAIKCFNVNMVQHDANGSVNVFLDNHHKIPSLSNITLEK